MARPDAGEETERAKDFATDTRALLRAMGPGVEALVPVGDEQSVTLGRGPGVDCVLDHPSVSRVHAEVSARKGSLLVKDLGSRNGTLVGGIRIDAGRAVPFQPGIVVQLGDVVLVAVRASREEPEPARVSAAMKPVYDLLDRVAADDATILLTGETGVGKEVLANRIHARSHRASGPLVKLHCMALSPTLIESELFGHDKGAFTGAVQAKVGLLQLAHGGTVFIDEVGEISLDLQVKLLRVLEEKRVMKVGGRAYEAIDVRFVAATHRDLAAMVRAGEFREDLFYRLNEVPIEVPPLRDRVDEIQPLAELLLERACKERNRSCPVLTADAVEKLRAHPFPGNVRELKNVITRALLVCDQTKITAADLTLASVSRTAPHAGERERILQALTKCAGNQTDAAKLLGMARRTLLYKIDALGIPRPRKGDKPST